jgi:beta-1,4-mannosyl-glycoprotein beta-1,4-N-acetylglucosaminyltransferase
MKIFDVFMFNKEVDLLEARLEYLYPVVDYFIITEADIYFTGQKKIFFFDECWDRFKKYQNKIIYNKISNIPDNFNNFHPPHKNFSDYNRKYNHKHFKSILKLKKQFQIEIYIRDSQILGLVNVAEHDDIIISSDLDEFVDSKLIKDIKNNLKIIHKEQHLNVECHDFIYSCNFKNKKRKWYGPRIFKYDYLNGRSFDEIRYPLTSIEKQIFETEKNSGYHFTCFGNLDLIKHKLKSASFNGSKYFYFYKILYGLFPFLLNYRIKSGKNYFFSFKNTYEKIKPEEFIPPDLIKIMNNFMNNVRK